MFFWPVPEASRVLAIEFSTRQVFRAPQKARQYKEVDPGIWSESLDLGKFSGSFSLSMPNPSLTIPQTPPQGQPSISSRVEWGDPNKTPPYANTENKTVSKELLNSGAKRLTNKHVCSALTCKSSTTVCGIENIKQTPTFAALTCKQNLRNLCKCKSWCKRGMEN